MVLELVVGHDGLRPFMHGQGFRFQGWAQGKKWRIGCSMFGYLAARGVGEMRLQQPRSCAEGVTGYLTRDPVSKQGMATAFF
jgi:hypothetical protein